MLGEHEMQMVYIENIEYKLCFWDCTRKKIYCTLVKEKKVYCILVANEKNKIKPISDNGLNFYSHLMPNLQKMYAIVFQSLKIFSWKRLFWKILKNTWRTKQLFVTASTISWGEVLLVKPNFILWQGNSPSWTRESSWCNLYLQ